MTTRSTSGRPPTPLPYTAWRARAGPPGAPPGARTARPSPGAIPIKGVRSRRRIPSSVPSAWPTSRSPPRPTPPSAAPSRPAARSPWPARAEHDRGRPPGRSDGRHAGDERPLRDRSAASPSCPATAPPWGRVSGCTCSTPARASRSASSWGTPASSGRSPLPPTAASCSRPPMTRRCASGTPTATSRCCPSSSPGTTGSPGRPRATTPPAPAARSSWAGTSITAPTRWPPSTRASQFRKSLYRPDVVKLIPTTGSTERALEVADRARGKATERVEVAEVLPPTRGDRHARGRARASRRRKLEVKAIARSRGEHPVTALRLLLDGRPYRGQGGVEAVDLAPARRGPRRPGRSCSSRAAHASPSRPRAPSARPSPQPVEVTYESEEPVDVRPNLYVLAIGISAYPGDLRLQLRRQRRRGDRAGVPDQERRALPQGRGQVG